MHSNPRDLHSTASLRQGDSMGLERYDTRGCDYGALAPFPATNTPAFGKISSASGSFWRESLALMEQHIAFGRRKVRADEEVYRCGDAFDTLFLVSSGLFKIVNLAPDGREQPSGLYLKGDWLGFDGIPTGHHGCSAISLDIGELWTIRYETLLQASVREPILMRLVLAAISAQLARNRDVTLSMGTLSADARVADFLLQWAHSLEERGMRTDQINVHMSRADIGNHLGLRLESVSRALSKLARCGVIRFNEKGRREITIPCLKALSDFIQSNAAIDSARAH
jgi:CRP/FNR family transcriptional regulator, anaerobic regulatory protein